MVASPAALTVPAARPASRRAASSSKFVFVTNDLGFTGSEVDYWPVGSTGDVAPVGVIGGPATDLVFGIQGIVVDARGEIYVASGSTNAILGFPPNANGNVAPNVVIAGAATGIVSPIGLAVDDAGNLYVANCGTKCTQASGEPSIEEFGVGSNGNAAPLRRIAGDRTQLDAPFGIALGRNGDIYVVDTDYYSPPARILAFGPQARGDAKPGRVITGANTQLDVALGVAVDTNGIYTVSWQNAEIERFALHATGDVAPVAVIGGSKTQLTCCLDGIITSHDDTVYAVDRGTPQIIEFDARTTGPSNEAPLSNISGPNTRLSTPLFVFVGAQP